MRFWVRKLVSPKQMLGKTGKISVTSADAYFLYPRWSTHLPIPLLWLTSKIRSLAIFSTRGLRVFIQIPPALCIYCHGQLSLTPSEEPKSYLPLFNTWFWKILT